MGNCNKEVFNVCIIAPNGNPHYQAFMETAELIYFSLKDLNHECILTLNQPILDGYRTIILGYQFLPDDLLNRLFENTIIFNLDPIYFNTNQFRHQALKWLSKYQAWDYAHQNIDFLSTLNIRSKLFEFGYQRHLNRIPSTANKTIDVLLYGSPSDRRLHVLHEISTAGFTTKHVYGIYGKERDLLISKSKIILNVYSEKYSLFDSVRCFYPMANSKVVISESSGDLRDAPILRQGVLFEEYSNLTVLIKNILSDAERFNEQEKISFECIKKIDQVKILSDMI